MVTVVRPAGSCMFFGYIVHLVEAAVSLVRNML